MRKVRLLVATVVAFVMVLPFLAAPAQAGPIPCGQKIKVGHAYVGEVPCIFQ
jgi:hypothetical protein